MKFTHQDIFDQIKDGKNLYDCFTELYKDLWPTINNLRKKFGVDKEDAKDLLQNVIIKLYENIKDNSYKEKGNLHGYIYGITQKKLINIYKRNLHEKKYIETLIQETDEAIEVDETIEAELINEKREKYVISSMEKLKGKCREILTDFYYGGMSLMDIAIKYGFKNANVAKNIKGRCFGDLKNIIHKP
jgi:RNA polymerase sigma factor (sigma-70 family)